MDELTKWENVIKTHAKKVQSETGKEVAETEKKQVRILNLQIYERLLQTC